MKTWKPPKHLPGRAVATPYNVPILPTEDVPAATIPISRPSTPNRMPIYVDQELLMAPETNPEIFGIHLGAGRWEVETEDHPEIPEYSAIFIEARSGAKIMLTFFTKEARNQAINMTTARRKVLSFGDKTASEIINEKIKAQAEAIEIARIRAAETAKEYLQNYDKQAVKNTAIGVGILATLGGLLWWYKK